jgi:hypothetical protein
LRFVVRIGALSVAMVSVINDAFYLAEAAVPTKDQPPLAVDADRLDPSQNTA